jgi:hypothetical protein
MHDLLRHGSGRAAWSGDCWRACKRCRRRLPGRYSPCRRATVARWRGARTPPQAGPLALAEKRGLLPSWSIGWDVRPSRRRPLAIARRPQAPLRRSQPPGRTRAALAARSHGGRLPRPVVKAPIPARAVGRFGQRRRRRTMPDWVGAATATAASGWLSSAASAGLKGDGGYLARARRSASMQWNALHTSRICDAIFPLDPA